MLQLRFAMVRWIVITCVSKKHISMEGACLALNLGSSSKLPNSEEAIAPWTLEWMQEIYKVTCSHPILGYSCFIKIVGVVLKYDALMTLQWKCTLRL